MADIMLELPNESPVGFADEKGVCVMKKLISLVLSLMMVLSLAACAAAEGEYTYAVAAPSGAPGLALATLAVENPEAYTFVSAETITAEFSNENADFIIAPVNAGAKLFRAGKSTYKLAAVVTWGNLYIASQKENFKLEDVNGASITLFGENTINASVVLHALAGNNLVPEKVEYLAGAANTQSLLLSDPEAIVVTAEPALTAAGMKNGNITSYAVNDLYKNVTGFDGYTQAGLFVKAETAEKNPEMVRWFLAQAEGSCQKCTDDVPAAAEAAVKLEILPNPKVAAAAIPGCAIRFLNAKDAREQVETTAQVDLTQFGGELPADEFYYVAE